MKKTLTLIALIIALIAPIAQAGYDDWTEEQQLAFRTELAGGSQYHGSKQAMRWMNSVQFDHWEYVTNAPVARPSYDEETNIISVLKPKYFTDFTELKNKTSKEIKNKIMEAINEKYDAAATDAERIAILRDAIDVKEQNDFAKTEGGGITPYTVDNKLFGKATRPDIRKVAVYTLSKTEQAVAPGVKATCSDIEKARSNM
jgi:hypothetical protein